MREKNQQLINILGTCIAECSHCAISCLQDHDVEKMQRCIRLNLDCAEICQLMMGFVGRNSEHAEHIARECAEIGHACATECEKYTDMEDCKRCAEACRACAEACEAGVAV